MNRNCDEQKIKLPQHEARCDDLNFIPAFLFQLEINKKKIASLNVSTTGKCQVEDIHLNVSLYISRDNKKKQTRNMKENKKIINLWHKTYTQYVSRVSTICCALCVVIVSEYNARINLFGHKFSLQLFHIASHSVEHKRKVFFMLLCAISDEEKVCRNFPSHFTRSFRQHFFSLVL